nr:hypothetical protein 42 [bacterium]
MTTQSRSLRFADQLARSPYSSIGSYPLYAVTSDGACLCSECCSTEREAIGTTTGNDGWCVVGIDVNYENTDLTCDHCGNVVEAAYA